MDNIDLKKLRSVINGNIIYGEISTLFDYGEIVIKYRDIENVEYKNYENEIVDYSFKLNDISLFHKKLIANTYRMSYDRFLIRLTEINKSE